MKKYVSVFLSLVLVLSFCISACATTTNEKNTADALNSLQLFLGMDIDENGNPVYGLDQNLTREQGVMLLLRMLGLEETAKNYTGTHPFVDVKNHYYDPYIAYAYSIGLVKGTDVDKFSGDMAMSQQMFATFCMRPLGYQDGKDADFLYDDAIAFAASKGVSKTANTEGFTRGDAVMMFWQTLNATCKDSDQTLAGTLIEKGLFSASAYEAAKQIQQKGKTTESSSTETGGSSGGGGGTSGGGSGTSGGGSTRQPCTHTNTTPKETPATCTLDGKIEYFCDSCGILISTDVIPATGHTLDKNGKCTKCGYEENKVDDTHELPAIEVF